MNQPIETANPKHIAVIMDGNGRWAKQQGYHRLKGHEQGAKTVRAITELAVKQNIPYLTLYAFSTENWGRPKIEVQGLMKLLSRAVDNELKTLMENDVALNVIGDMDNLPTSLAKKLDKAMELTRSNSKLTLTLALSYSSQDELTRVYKKMMKNGITAESISPEIIEQYLDSASIPSVDILIRTGGEQRLSNFMLWQLAYAELFFVEDYWPEFTNERFMEILDMYTSRERRFGKISEQIKL